MGNGGSALGDCLPGVEGGSGGKCGDVKVDGWDNPAYVTYVGGVFEVAVEVLLRDWLKDWFFHCFGCIRTEVIPGDGRELFFVLI